jgi:hypothetical protein
MAALPAAMYATTAAAPIDAIIIGAGPAGVVSLRNLLRVQLNAICIERQAAVGGVWIDHTPKYSSLQSLRADWGLHGVPCGSSNLKQRRFLRDDVCSWVQEYVARQGIKDRIFLSREVLKVTPIKPMLFAVDVCSVKQSGYLGGGTRLDDAVHVYARSVLVCAGTPSSTLVDSRSRKSTVHSQVSGR